MQEATGVVESDNAMTRRRLKEAGFGDEQVQALVDVTGAERRALSADMAGLKASEERVKSEIALLRTESGAFRTEMRGEISLLRTEAGAFRTEMRGEIAAVHTRIDGLRDAVNARFDGVRDEMNARFERVDAKFDGLDSRLKLILWFMGVGVTLYAGTTVSLVMILFRDAPV